MQRLRHRLAACAAGLLALTACGGTTVTSFPQEQAKAAAFLQADLSTDADPVALADQYARDPAAGLVRGGSSPRQLLVFLDTDASKEQIRELEARLRREPGVDAVTLRRGVEPPPLNLEVPASPAG